MEIMFSKTERKREMKNKILLFISGALSIFELVMFCVTIHLTKIGAYSINKGIALCALLVVGVFCATMATCKYETMVVKDKGKANE